MKNIAYFGIIFLATVLTTACNKSPKKILLSDDEWFIEKPDDSIENTSRQTIKFSDSTIVSIGETDGYNISWLDGFTFKLNKDGETAIFNIKSLSKEKLKVAVLYEKEKIPVSTEEWEELLSENRVLYLTKNVILKKKPEIFRICGQDIPADKVPPEGTYILKGHSGDVIGVVKVIIDNGNVKFQTGENENSLKDTPIDSFDEYGSFQLKDFMMSGSYQGNGVIQFFTGAQGVDEGEQYDNYIIESISNSHEELLGEAVRSANDIEFIYKGGEKFGKIVKVVLEGYLPHSYEGGVTELDVPEGKMWTPLYYEQIKGRNDGSAKMEIFYKTNYGYGYYEGFWYKFDVTNEQFVSCKFSKQNNRAFVKKDRVAVILNSWSKYKSKFIFYCLEEPI